MPLTPNIRPVSDLRNKFAEISREAHETNAPVYLTKNGHSNLVVMSVKAYEADLFEAEVYRKLRESEVEAASTKKRYSHAEVFDELYCSLDEADKGRDAA